MLIEKEIRENYAEYRDIWSLKNKFKVPAELLVRHYIYEQLHSDVLSIYPSPVSSDIGIKTSDAVICIDLKTIDTVGNPGDLHSTSVENNQTSFDNSNYDYITISSNLKSIDHYNDRPVLTYIVKLIYSDNNYSFSLSRDKFPTMALACVPNGELSYFFDKNIIDNIKVYNYYTQKEDPYFTLIPIPKKISEDEKNKLIEDKVFKKRSFQEITISKKRAYYDARKQITWWETTINKKRVIAPVKGGSNVRFNNETLQERFDENDEPWIGYTEIYVQDIL